MSSEHDVAIRSIADATAPAVQSVLLRLRKEKGLTQKELQVQLGVSYNTIAFAERGLVLSKRTAQKFGEFYGVTILPIVSARRKVTAEKRLAKRQDKALEAQAKADAVAAEPLAVAIDAAVESVKGLAGEIKNGTAAPAANEPSANQ